MKSIIVLGAALVGSAAICATTTGQIPPAPAFPKSDTADTIQGARVADPWRALENAADPAVKAWSDAQNARTRAYLDALPGRSAITTKITHFLRDRSPSVYFLEARPGAVFGFYLDPAKQQPALVILDPAAGLSSHRAVIDPNLLDPSGHTAIDWYVASPDGTRVAVSLSKNGSEDGTLHIYDVTTGKEIEAPIDRVQFPTAGGALAWTADGQGFWYTRYPGPDAPEAERHFNQALYLHRIGSDAAQDGQVLGASNGLPRTAEIYLDGSRGGPFALASVELGDGGQFEHYVLKPDGSAVQISHFDDHVIGGAVITDDGTVFGVSRADAPMGKVLKLTSPYTGGFAKAAVFAPEDSGAAVIDGGEFETPLVLTKDRLFVSRIAGGPSKVTSYALTGGDPLVLDLPAVSSAFEIDAAPGGEVLYRVGTYTEPFYYMRWDAKTRAATRTGLVMTSPISFADAQVTRIFATSKDGAKVPVTVISRKGVTLDGSHPVLLTGYGGYGINQVPRFAGAQARLWLDAGGVYAEANLRGGGEYGERWHTEGMLTKKQNVFDDMAAAAQTLIDRGYTKSDKLALIGGSNGGLLMGAMITQHPKLERAVVSAVGIYDMLRVELDPNGAFNVSEFGTVTDPAQFKALYAYSPYQNVHTGTAYPAVLMTTGANDGRVNPLHSRKFTAALQAATSSPYPILLRTSANSGHGIGNSVDEIIAETTDRIMFLFDQLGMDAAQAGR